MKKLEISKIRRDGGTQMRADLDEATVAEYRELFANGVEMEAVEVYFDGMAYWLADGFQRVAAALDAGLDKILAHVTTGTRRDAILYACGANAIHGLKRSNSDKRRAVETLLNDEEWVKWSDGKIADAAAVSRQFVSDVRAQLATVASSPAAKTASEPRVGKDSKTRKAPAPKADKPEREPKAVPQHVVPTPPASEKKKITGGTTFNVEEFSSIPLSELKDGQGNAVPKSLAMIFKAGEDFERAMRLCSEAKSIVGTLKAGPAGFHLSNGMAETDLKNARTAIKFAKPFVPCPRKLDDHSLCKQCKGTGYLTEAMFEAMSKAKGGAA